jgi:hypothetical protein
LRKYLAIFCLACLVTVGVFVLSQQAHHETYRLYTRHFSDKEIVILQKTDFSPYNTWTVFVADNGVRKLVFPSSSREQGECIKEIFLSKDQRYVYLKAISTSAGFDLVSGNLTRDARAVRSSLSEHGGIRTQIFPPYEGQMQQREIAEREAQAWLKLVPTPQNH